MRGPNSLYDCLGIAPNKDVEVNIVDVGANLLVDRPPYQGMLDRKHASVVGFEPNLEALEKLRAQATAQELYLPDAVGADGESELKLCRMSGMTSLLEPNFELLNMLHYHPIWAEIKERVPLKTRRLDDIAEIKRMDMLKIDIQGGELAVFENAARLLEDTLLVHTECMFVPMYVDQPLYADQAGFLQKFGLYTHKFYEIAGHVLKPFTVRGDRHAPLSQLFWADVIFIKDLTKLDTLTPDQLLRLASMLNDIYRSFDVAHLALAAYDRKQRTSYAQTYALLLQRLSATPPKAMAS
jgi:FkbM family methyltransferase